jgi:hypothetical protein
MTNNEANKSFHMYEKIMTPRTNARTVSVS